MFQLTFIKPANSLSSTVMVEGYPVVVEISLPSDILSYKWEGDNLVFQVEHQDEESRKAWDHSLKYLVEALQPQSVQSEKASREEIRKELFKVYTSIDFDRLANMLRRKGFISVYSSSGLALKTIEKISSIEDIDSMVLEMEVKTSCMLEKSNRKVVREMLIRAKRNLV
jgi:hypothetical protein